VTRCTESEAWARFHRALGIPQPTPLHYTRLPKDFADVKGLAGLDLIARAQAGDRGLENAIIRVNERFVRKVVWPYWQTNPWNREDITQAGRCGLLYALREKFDPTLGYELTTYARSWIEHYAQRWLRDKRQPIRVPVGAQEKAMAAMKAGATSEHDVRVMKGKYAAAAWVNRFAPLSLDKDIETRDGTIRLLDVVADHDAIDPAAALETTRAKALVATALLALTPMERHVIQARHLREGRLAEETLLAIGKRHKLSRERIRQYETRGMRRLKAALTKLRAGKPVRPAPTPRAGTADYRLMRAEQAVASRMGQGRCKGRKRGKRPEKVGAIVAAG